ncbi:Uncharacterized protein PEX1_103610 [Penicillium expansum]|nr:Uncharacterized protein PEX1_103610 [Penicillium expansum]
MPKTVSIEHHPSHSDRLHGSIAKNHIPQIEGLPVTDALRDSILKHNSGGKSPNPVSSAFQFTAGLLFFGVPFQGRGGPSTEEWIKKIKEHHKNDPDFQVWNQTMTASVPKSQFLQGLVGQYLETRSNFIVVSKTSACLQRSKDVSQVPLDRNHYNLNRFEGPEDPVWKMVVPEIQQRAGYASEFLSRRDQGEDIPSRVDCYFSDIEGTDLGFAVNWSLYHLTKTAHFVARESDLEKMEGLLQKQNGRRSVVVSGLGGMGKTQLAIKYAQLHQDEYSAVFFLDITSDKSMRKSYDVIAARITADHPTTNRLEVTPEKNEQNSNAVVSAVKKWLELPKNTSWLMVFDNYDNPAVPTNTHPERVDIQNYLPACNHGSVIVTTRVENVKLDSQSSMKIEKVSDLHGQEILAKTSGRQGVLKNKNTYKLATKLGGHPLALAIAGSYLRTSHMSFENYLAFYESEWKRLQTKSPKSDSYNHTLLTTWHITVDQLKKDHPSSIKMLKILGYTTDGIMSYKWLKAGSGAMPKAVQRIVQDELDFGETMRHLVNYGLVELVRRAVDLTQDEPMRYTMHSVVHTWCKHDLNEELDVELAWSVYACAMIPPDEPDMTALRALIASHDSAWSQLTNVWWTNENIRNILQQQKGFKFPSDWEALDFLLGAFGYYGSFALPGTVDDLEEIIPVQSTHFKAKFNVPRSCFLPQELKDTVAKGVSSSDKSFFVHFPTIESLSPRRSKPQDAMSLEKMQMMTGNLMRKKALRMESERNFMEHTEFPDFLAHVVIWRGKAMYMHFFFMKGVDCDFKLYARRYTPYSDETGWFIR